MRAFRCARTGLYYPSDYIEEWGRKYGIGLGSEPKSEALVNRYDLPVCESKDGSHTMHPVGVCRAQVDLVDITQSEYDSRPAIIAQDDPDMSQRSSVLRYRQLLKSSKMQTLFPDESASAIKAEAKF